MNDEQRLIDESVKISKELLEDLATAVDNANKKSKNLKHPPTVICGTVISALFSAAAVELSDLHEKCPCGKCAQVIFSANSAILEFSISKFPSKNIKSDETKH